MQRRKTPRFLNSKPFSRTKFFPPKFFDELDATSSFHAREKEGGRGETVSGAVYETASTGQTSDPVRPDRFRVSAREL